jgi:hypothetical protein
VRDWPKDEAVGFSDGIGGSATSMSLPGFLISLMLLAILIWCVVPLSNGCVASGDTFTYHSGERGRTRNPTRQTTRIHRARVSP